MSENQIKVLRIKRGSTKRALNSFENFLNRYNPETDRLILEKRFAEIEITRETFLALQAELEVLEDDTEEVHQYKIDFEETYFDLYGKAHSFLFPITTTHSQSTHSQSSVAIALTNGSIPNISQEVPNLSQVINNNSLPNIGNQGLIDNQITELTAPRLECSVSTTPNYSVANKSCLPTISLPTFSGSFDSWLGFHDLFNSLVNEDNTISPIRKLFYLKSCLSGEAANVISSIESSSHNYEVAWNLLKERYDDRKIIRDKHIQSLLDTPGTSKDFSTRAFVDHVQKNLRALKALGEPIDSWNSIIIVILHNKLDNFLRDKWEDHCSDVPNPTIDQMITFLTKRAHFESVRSQSCHKLINPRPRPSGQTRQAFKVSVSQARCIYCSSNDHFINNCNKFIELNPFTRYETAKKKGWCTNCLRNTHQSSQCTSSSCRKCSQRHHTLLHFDKSKTSPININRSESQSSSQESSSKVSSLHARVSSEALLATAVVDIVNSQGKSKSCRVFLDAGSQAHFITESLAQFLNLERTAVNISVSGVDDLCTNVKYAARATIRSRFSKFHKNIEFLIITHISNAMPSTPIDSSQLDIPQNIILADPEFYRPSTVDALIGVGLFYKLLCVGQIQLKNHPDAILQKTQLGWVIAGRLNHPFRQHNIACHLTFNDQFNYNLTRFWEIEEIPSTKILSPEEKLCEEHYLLNTTRDSSGRYVVRLPFRNNLNKLGKSYSSALRRFQSLEKRSAQNKLIHKDYLKFLEEYRELGHMSLSGESNTEFQGFYLPHHAVVKQHSLTTKIRVVFDGSAKTSTGVSLNDTLMVGPTLQDNLFTILIRYRSHSVVLTADIEKMYRQILVHPDDAKYQKIIFRSNSSDPILTYTLNTVTYGTASASYLAIRSLQQLADDEGQAFPRAAVVLKRDFYVDDLLTGANTRQEAMLLRDELDAIMLKGGFNLRKWASNDPFILHNCDQHPNTNHMSLDPDNSIKTLGIHWSAKDDIIFYSVNIGSIKTVTKRSILSQIAQLFDPLGLLGPVIVYAKIIMQMLWKAGVAWDESIPIEIHSLWVTYREELPLLESLRFHRCITIAKPVNVQIHGFCDASEKAYGGCLYLRSVDKNGQTHIRLICSKSRVAPVSSISLPRLELCGAVLLARLFHTIQQTLLFKIDDIFLWSDSTISLHWLNSPPHRLKTFVSNRVAEVQRLTSNCHWRHVASLDNPADLVSRGQHPSEFIQGKLWQQGPSWLQESQCSWPTSRLPNVDLPELRTSVSKEFTCLKLELRGFPLIERYESWDKTVRIVAYLLRYINNLKLKELQRIRNQLTSAEMNSASEAVVKMTQVSAFSSEINCLKKGLPISENSRLIPLSPFLDSAGILRVGGRLAQADLPVGQRHPMLLPANHHITRIIIREEHIRLNHAGAQATLYSVRQIYWPLDSRNITRKVIHQCVTCFRARPRFADHSMGNLPAYRVSQSRPFLRVGVDYCGPLYIKQRRHRNRQKLKVYVAVYICMSTRAVHLEVVSDLTTEAFIASLKRFFSRRGRSTDVFSDNATNFVGASRELDELYKLFNSAAHKNLVQSYMHQQKINWHFIPPMAPHFGGLWEAAVKSFKKHLIRTVGDTLLTYDQLETCVVEIEAILNSRPISPLSSDPNDILPLTPGHFLIGDSLTSFPQIDWTDTPPNRLSAWQHAQQLKQHFWKRWYKEYLHQLITRPSHHKRFPNLEIGTLVLISEDNLPPLQWSLGRIIAVHPGKDGVVRAVTVKTNAGEYERCTRKLCPLPLDNSTTYQY